MVLSALWLGAGRRGLEMRTQTLKGWRIDMRAECQKGHERIPMQEDHVHKRFYCVECDATITPDRIYAEVPSEYKPSGETIISTVQGLLDYEIVGVIMEDGSLFIEYPRNERA